MEAVILAAGMGTRLGSLIPKPLTSLIDEKTILDYQIEKLLKIPQINNIYIVVGYKKQIIMEKFPDFLFVYNSAYARTNTAKSLLSALNKIDDDVIWMNGDVFFDEKILDLLIDSKESACLVDQKKCGLDRRRVAWHATSKRAAMTGELQKWCRSGFPDPSTVTQLAP